jgi:ankyrin repeat protein
MKHLLITTIAAVVLVGWGESQSTAKAPDISIHDAAEEGNIEAVKKHLADGVDVNAKREDGSTPLYYAAMFSHGEIVETLIANGADVNAKDFSGKTILDTALYTPLPGDGGKTIEILRKHGAKSSAEDSIHDAAAEGNIEAVKEYLAAGGDVNAKSDFATPLHYARTKEIAEMLIAAGAGVNAKDALGETPLDRANRYKQLETADLLRKHGGKTGEELKAEGKRNTSYSQQSQPWFWWGVGQNHPRIRRRTIFHTKPGLVYYTGQPKHC